MGRYTDPQMIIDKRFEKTQAQLDKMYSDVNKNLAQITARKQKQRQQQAKKITDYYKRYNDATAEGREAANDFANTRDVSNEKKAEFSKRFEDLYDSGIDEINLYASGKDPRTNGRVPSEAEINKFINSKINQAGNLTRQIVTLEGLVSEHRQGAIQAGASDPPGKADGSNVVGGEYDQLLRTMGIDGDNDAALWDNFGMVGSLEKGVSLFFDNNRDGTISQDDDLNEVLNLGAVAKNVGKGKTKSYLKKVASNDDIYTPSVKQAIKVAAKNKMGNFATPVAYTDENGNTVMVDVLSAADRQDYFLNGNGKSIIDGIVTGEERMLVQKYFGVEAAAKFDPTKEQDMMKLRARVLEANDFLMEDPKAKLRPNKKTYSTQFTKNTNAEVVGDFYKDVHGQVNDLTFGKVVNGKVTADDERIKQFNLYVQDRPFGFGGKTRTVKNIEILDQSQPNRFVLVMDDGTKVKPPNESYFDLNTPLGREKLEEGLMKGNFKGDADQRHVDGYLTAQYDSEEKDYTTYKGSETKTSRITNSSSSGITFDKYKQLDANSKELIKSDNIAWTWEDDADTDNSVQAQLNIQPQASATTGTVNQAEEMKGVEVKTQDIAGAANAAKPDDDPTKTMKYGELSQTSFGGKDYKETGRVGEKAVYKNDNSLDDQYRKIINFETIAGSTSGSGVGNYGFTDTDTYPDTPQSPEEAVKYIKTAVVPKVEKDLGFKLEELDSIPKNVTASLVDYKMNTGRSMDDLLIIAYQNQKAIEGEKVKKTWDGISASRNLAPKPSKEVYDALKSGKISAEALAAAKDELYLGRIKEMMNMVEKNPNAKDKNGRLIKDKLGDAKTAYKNSHSNRVNMFK